MTDNTDRVGVPDHAVPYSLNDLLRIMQRLRDPDTGCPWDVKQTMASIVPFTLEECYELADAIEQEDSVQIADELGDVLFQVVFYSEVGREQGLFDFEQVVQNISDKLIRRHPHVFANGDIEGVVESDVSETDVKVRWEEIKRGERRGKAQSGVLDDVPRALPAMVRAQKLQKRAASVGFDWTEVDDVLANLESEIAELRDALIKKDDRHIADEFGDVLFSAINLGRHLGLDSESALRASNAKFEHRFRVMETVADARHQSLSLLPKDELEALWCEAKNTE